MRTRGPLSICILWFLFLAFPARAGDVMGEPPSQPKAPRAASVAQPAPELAVLDPDDAAVFSAILSDFDKEPNATNAKSYLVHEFTKACCATDPDQQPLGAGALFCGGWFQDAPQSLWTAFVDRNQVQRRLPAFSASKPVGLLQANKKVMLEGQPKAIEESRFREDFGALAVVVLSLPGYNHRHTAAFVHAEADWGVLWAKGYHFLLEKAKSGGWVIRKRWMVMIQ